MNVLKAYNHILVATNLTKESDAVAEKAKSIAERANAKLSIVHIIEFSPILYGGGEFAIPLNGDIEASLQQRAKDALAKIGDRVGVAEDNRWIEMGTTTSGLLDLVKKLDIDLLVVGCHEQHGLGLLLGSISNTLMHEMICDVLAVRV